MKKILAFNLLGLIIWITLVYISISFIELEFNPFVWSQETRSAMVFFSFIYIGFTPLISFLIEDLIKYKTK